MNRSSALGYPRSTLKAAEPLTRTRSESREIDLAGRPTNRVVWLGRLFARLGQITFWIGVTVAALPIFWVARRSRRRAVGAALSFLFQRLGATFIKIGQIMSTRPDLFPREMTEPLTKLQDQVPPFGFASVRRMIEQDFGREIEDIFAAFDPTPVASASIAQVHRAVLHEAELPPTLPSRVVAVKVRRPRIVRRAYLDESILRFGARLLSLVPTFSFLSPVEAVSEFCEAVNKQLDFTIEAANNRRFAENFEGDPHVVLPLLVDQLCSDRVLTMEFIDGVKEDKIRAIGADPKFVSRKIIEIGARMVFDHGLVHADLHPGNLLFLAGNRLALLDVGLTGASNAGDRRRFAFMTYYSTSGMGAEAAKWFYEQSGRKPIADYAAYEREVTTVVQAVHEATFEQSSMTARLIELFDILRRHRVRLEPSMTMPSIALIVAEGIARRLHPKLNPGREIRPHVMSAMALSVTEPEAEAAPPPIPAPPTSIAAGRYRIRRLLGEGVRKRVYLARDTRLERDVAVALIRTEGLDDAGRTAIDREARAVARLADHPRIVPVYDSGDEAGVPYVVSQYMGGGTLSGALLRASEHRLPIDTALRYGDQILQALEHAHENGIVHRDVKPENVWLTEDGFAKLGDFGLASALGPEENAASGSTVGTALYMSPEQARGRGVDSRTDLYSFGATLYELLTGQPPFVGESVADVIACHVNATPQAPSLSNPAVPPALDAIVLRLLAKQPERRFESAATAREALRDVSRPADPAAIEAPSVRGSDEAIAASTPAIFVGREQEIARMRKGLEEALAGRGRFFVLVGEPGIGKTRVAELVAGYAKRRGCLVFTGRSFEGEGAPAFWPWVQILRGYLERKPAGVESELGPDASYIAQIVSEVRDAIPEPAELSLLEGEEARFRLFDAVTSFLKRAAAVQPLFLFVDDLHWADKPSLLLLLFLVRELAQARIFVVGAYRDVDVQHGHPLADVLPALRREHAFERVLLRGLPETDVRALVAALAETEVPEAFVRAIHRETEGNPFFIEETMRHLAEEGVVSRGGGKSATRLPEEPIGLPEGVREVIGRRLARLSGDCRKMLVTASVVGREFDARVLEHVTHVETGRLLELLAEAALARVVETEKAGFRHRFSHALIRETLYAELGAAERVRLHQRIAEALHALHGGDPEEHLSELAYHFFEAAPAGDVEPAIEYATRAAERANRQFAYEEAAGFYERALGALETQREPRDEARRCDLLIGLGTAQGRSGDDERANETLRRATELAARSGRTEAVARAALLYAGEELQPLFMEQNVVPVLEMALAALPDEDSGSRAMLMGRLGGIAAFSRRYERNTPLLDQGLAMAIRIGDERAEATVTLSVLFTRWGTKSLAEVRTLSERLTHVATKLRDQRLHLAAAVLAGMIAAEASDVDGADRAFAEVERIADEIREPRLSWFGAYTSAGWALRAAKASEADAILQRSFDRWNNGGSQQGTMSLLVAQRTMVAWQQGRLDENEPIIAQQSLPQDWVDVAMDKVIPAFLAAQVGRRAEARATVESVMSDSFATFERDPFEFPALVFCAAIIDAIGGVRGAEALYERLLPYADRLASVAGGYYLMSTNSALGLLAKQLGRLDDAVRHFAAALVVERGMPIVLARTRHHYATVLALRAAPGDWERALGLCAEAIEGAETYGLAKLGADALALKLELEGVARTSARSSIDALTASIERKGIDAREVAAPDGTVTLLFSDIEGFSEMNERLGDAEAHRVMQVLRRIVRAELHAHQGRDIEEQGDGLLLAFARASDALRYAIAVQRKLAEHRERHPDPPIHVRIGIHTGEPIREGKRFFGKTVILAARIAGHAAGDEILTSSLVHDLTESTDFVFDAGEEVVLPGLLGEHRIHGLVWDPHFPARRSRSRAENVFRREGSYWTIVYEGRSIRMKDAKGVQYMAMLLGRRGEDVHVADLVNGAQIDTSRVGFEAATGLEVAADLGDAGEAIDAKARRDYRERVESLRSELDEARERNDAGRAERLQQELDFITQELSSAYGLGGRARKNASAADRARKAVCSRLSDSIARIGKENPELGVHLDNSIRLGLFCRYAPEKPVAWSL